MAQWFVDCSEYTIGQQPSGWTKRWSTVPTWSAQMDTYAGGSEAVYTRLASLTRTLLACDAPGSPTDCAILATCRFGDGTYAYMGVGVRCSGTSLESSCGYIAYLNAAGNNAILARVTDNVGAILGSANIGTVATTDRYRILLEATGTTIRMKCWKKSEAEPEAWSVSVVDSTYSSGFMGLYARSDSQDFYWDDIGIGAYGDTAPSGQIGVGETISFLVDTRQRIYTPGYFTADTEQRIWTLATLQGDTKQRLYVPAAALADTEQRVYSEEQAVADTKQRVYAKQTLLADTRQRIGKTYGLLSDTRQKVYAPESMTADTKQRVYHTEQFKADTKQVVYSLLSLSADTKQRVWVGFSFLADTMQVIGKFGSALRKVTVKAMVHRFGTLTGAVNRRQSLTATVRRRDDA